MAGTPSCQSGSTLVELEVSPAGLPIEKLQAAAQFNQKYSVNKLVLTLGHSAPTNAGGEIGVCVISDPADPNPFAGATGDAAISQAFVKATQNRGYSHGTIYRNRRVNLKPYLGKGERTVPTEAAADTDAALLRQTSNGKFIVVVHQTILGGLVQAVSGAGGGEVDITLNLDYEFAFWEPTRQEPISTTVVFSSPLKYKGGKFMTLRGGIKRAATYRDLAEIVAGRTVSCGKFVTATPLFTSLGNDIYGFALEDIARSSAGDEHLAPSDLYWVDSANELVDVDPDDICILVGSELVYVANTDDVMGNGLQPCAPSISGKSPVTLHTASGSLMSYRLLNKQQAQREFLANNFKNSLRLSKKDSQVTSSTTN